MASAGASAGAAAFAPSDVALARSNAASPAGVNRDRGAEAADLFAYVASGGAVYPPELLQPEGAPLRAGG